MRYRATISIEREHEFLKLFCDADKPLYICEDSVYITKDSPEDLIEYLAEKLNVIIEVKRPQDDGIYVGAV